MKKRRKKHLSERGPCIFCGATVNLEFHHLDPEEKESNSIWSWSEKRILEELKKCVVMCKHCHKTFHGILKRRPLVHGTCHAYRVYGCRCDRCRSAKAAYDKQYKERRQTADYVDQRTVAQKNAKKIILSS